MGTCGIDCNNCVLHKKDICEGCESVWKMSNPICPIVQCAKGKGISECSDCGEFPCSIFQKGYPYSQAYLGMIQSRM